jgi:dipeptidyl-peptidase-3
MRKKWVISFALITLLPVLLFASSKKLEKQRKYLLEQVKDVAIVQLYADGFKGLTPKERIFAYYLSKAAIAGDRMLYDQNHRYGLVIKDMLEEIITHPEGIDKDVHDRILTYTKLFWLHHGNYHCRTGRKFTPDFSYQEFVAAAKKALENGADFGVKDEKEFYARISSLKWTIFDPDYEPFLVNKSPEKPDDILTGSANNLYFRVTLREAEMFPEKYPLNSRLAKIKGKVVEQVYRAGGDGAPPGLYSSELSEMVYYLEKALPYTHEKQQEALRHLISYFKTGDLTEFRRYNISWVGDDPKVDTINGFIEVYGDARGIKGSYEGIVYFINEAQTSLMRKIAGLAPYFEAKAPWLDIYKKKEFKAPIANIVDILMETGDGGPISWGGINLPNAQDIRETYGSKSIVLQNISEGRKKASTGKLIEEFALTPEEVTLQNKYGDEASRLMVALHEVVGHGSGKMSPELKGDPAEYLKNYYSTMEEARADLMALWNIGDTRLKEVGISSDPVRVQEQAYRAYARSDLLLLRVIPEGNKVEEDHMRATHLIVSYLKDKTKAIEVVKKEGKIYYRVTSLKKMREGVGELLAEIMRVKAEGDYQAIKKLTDNYGSYFDPVVRDEVIARVNKLDLPNYTAFVMPKLIPVKDKSGEIIDVKITYPGDFVKEQLEFTGKVK